MLRTPPVAFVKAALKFRALLDYAARKTFPAPVSLLEIVTSQWVSQAVIVAAELGLADLLKEGPRGVRELSFETETHEESLYRLLRLLAARGIFSEASPRTFALNRLARPLLKDAPDSVLGTCRMVGAPFHRNAWDALLYSVQTGRSSLEHQQGRDLFQFLAADSKAGEVFDHAMTGWAAQSAQAVAQAVDFRRFRLFVDLGGGRGRFLAALLGQYPESRGLLFDQPHVIVEAGETFDRAGVSERVLSAGGSFFETIPRGGDAYFLKNIIHDWDDERAVEILRRVREALDQPGSRLFIVESVVPEGNEFHPGKLIDLEMLVCTSGGKERTEREFRKLLERAGLSLKKIHPTAAIESVIEISGTGPD